MARILSALILALAVTSPAAAQSSGAYYSATLEAPTAPNKIISSEVVWSAHANVLEAPISGDVARRVCAVLAQKVGTITQFTADGKALSSDDMGYCNKHARKAK